MPVAVRNRIDLPASKSISNRALVIHALANSSERLENLAVCDDTDVLAGVLSSNDHRFDIGHAGSAMRFLTAYLSRIAGCWELTGSSRMLQRPIGILVEALNRLGAKITYTGREGYPPLRIYGSALTGGRLEIPASVSSQFVSALLMVAPYMYNGLELELTGKVVSRTYIDMTLSLMKTFGAVVEAEGNCIRVRPEPYAAIPYRIENDWSAASYFYEWTAVAGSGRVELSGLFPESLQGDAAQQELWAQLGVQTCFAGETVQIEATGDSADRLEYDFVRMPDLVQSFAVACCLKGVPFCFSGVETLRLKETDRTEALVRELKKLGYVLQAAGNRVLSWQGETCTPDAHPEIETYHDHRMAMAFASAALRFPGIVVRDAAVVSKSFPAFWEEMGKLGLQAGVCG